MTPILLSGPAIEPAPLVEAKAWLRVDHNSDDDLISALITAARLTLEAATRSMFNTQSWRLVYDQWPGGDVFAIPLAPFLTLDGMRVRDAANVAAVVPPASYVLDSAPGSARIAFTIAPPAPGRAIGGIEIDVSVGFGAAAADVPAALRLAIKMLAARWYENRGDAVSDAEALPADIASVIAPFRRPRLA